MTKIVWREIPQRYGDSVHAAKVGRIKVGEAGWNSSKSKGAIGIDYQWRIYLPSLSEAFQYGKCATLEEAKLRVEQITRSWFLATEEVE